MVRPRAKVTIDQPIYKVYSQTAEI